MNHIPSDLISEYESLSALIVKKKNKDVLKKLIFWSKPRFFLF